LLSDGRHCTLQGLFRAHIAYDRDEGTIFLTKQSAMGESKKVIM
jgi:hypothetical protein